MCLIFYLASILTDFRPLFNCQDFTLVVYKLSVSANSRWRTLRIATWVI